MVADDPRFPPPEMPPMSREAVDHPAHYQGAGIEAIDVIEAFGLGFCLGNTVKYVLRAGRKGDAIEDLKKARWYLNREIQQREATAATKRRGGGP
jgi:hypothetical protein